MTAVLSIAADRPRPAKSADPAAAFQRLLQTVRERRSEFDTLRHMPRDVVDMMKEAGIYRASTPKCFGGDALAPHVFLKMVETVAEADGSAAWCVAFGSANCYLAALPYETQAKIYASGPDQHFAGGLYPLNPATEVEGGYKVTGRWRFASGCMGADWIGVGLLIPSADNAPRTVLGVLPAQEVQIIQNWDVMGMQGTGSFDTVLTDKVIDKAWVGERGAPAQIDEPLYRYPAYSYQAQMHAAVNLGLARAAVDLATSMSGAAKVMPGAGCLADRAYYRTGLANAEARLRSARAFYYETIAEAWETLVAGDPLLPTQKNMLRLCATHANTTSTEVVQACFRISGMAGIEKSHRMQHIVRDSLVVSTHASINDATLENCGAVLAGRDAPYGFLG